MASVVCFEQVKAADGPGTQWCERRDPPFVAERGGMLVAELPTTGKPYPRAYVNGLEVIAGVQRVHTGDLVRIVLAKDEVVSYVVGRCVAAREPGAGRTCAFTGLPIRGQAVRCACGLIVNDDVAAQLSDCPLCGRPLAAKVSEEIFGDSLGHFGTGQADWPPEELL